MDNLNRLEEKIKSRLSVAAERHKQCRELLAQEMAARDERIAHFNQTATRVMDCLIRPRIETVVSCFANAHLDKSDVDGTRCLCRFDHTPEYPASTTLELSLSRDSDVQSAIVTYDLDILPVFFQFKGHDQLVLPLNSFDESAVVSWIDARLLDFVDTYLRLPLVEQYQQENVVYDPVCGMRINSADAGASIEYGGKTYYFCVEECRQKFLQDPVHYASRQGV